MSRAAVALTIRGMVQGVGYRYFCYREALSLALVGWVANRSNGTVEAVVEGDKEHILDLISRLRQGPFGAHVTEIGEQWSDATGEFTAFTIER